MTTLRGCLKRILLLSLLLLSVLPSTAQKNRNTIFKVGVGELIYTPPAEGNKTTRVLKDVADVLLAGQTTKQQPQYAEGVRASVMNGLSKVILFRPSDGAITQSEMSDGMSSLFVDGTIANISVVSKTETTKDSKGNKHTATSYRSNISVTINLKDPVDGSVVNSHTFTLSDSDLFWMTSGEKAVTNALEHLTSKVADYYNKLFPLHASIIEKGEAKKNKQKEVYIDLGENDGVYKGMQFDVFTTSIIAGKEAKTLIGRLKIEDIKGEEISLCKVTKGADMIKVALDDGQPLLITSR